MQTGGSDLPSSFQVTCALSVEFGISSISSQRMTAVYPWCVGGCQPLSSPGILQTGQTCGCCFARSSSVFGCRLYAEHRQLACSHTRAQHWRHSTPHSTPGTLAGKSWLAMWEKKGVVREEKRQITKELCAYLDTWNNDRRAVKLCQFKGSNSFVQFTFSPLSIFSLPLPHSTLRFVPSKNGWPQTHIVSCHSPQKERSGLCLGPSVSHGQLWLELTIPCRILSIRNDREAGVFSAMEYVSEAACWPSAQPKGKIL